MSVRFDLSPIEKKALQAFAERYGRTWKSELVRAWRTRMGLRDFPYREALYRLQHVLGETGLDRIEIEVVKATQRTRAKPTKPPATRSSRR
jgi:hypothetical protein